MMNLTNKLKENKKLASELLDIADDMVANIGNVTPQSYHSFKEARKEFKNHIDKMTKNQEYLLEKLENLSR
jgi:hydroxyethylthiazole kinase-like sugar kinase family protein